MKHSRSPIGRFLTPWAVCLPLLAACSAKPSADSSTEIEIGPREKFDRVVERLKRQYQGSDADLTMHEKDGTIQRFQVRSVVNSITPQFHEPTTPEGKYTAEIVIRTSTYSTLISEERPPSEKDAEDEDADPLVPSQFDPGAQAIKNKASSAEITEELLSRTTQDQVVACDLEYDGDRWVLKSRNLPDSLQLAFEYALEQPGDELKLNPQPRFRRNRAGELGYPEKNFGDDYLPNETGEKSKESENSGK